MQDPKNITINGHTYSVADLMRQVGRRSVVNLRTGLVRRAGRPANLKYTLEDREWQAAATMQEIQQRYSVTASHARSMQWKARQILAQLGLHDPDSA